MQQPPFEQRMPGAGQQEPMASRGAMRGKATADRQATREVPREQLNKAMQAASSVVGAALYKNKKATQSVLKMVNPDDKVGSTAKAATMFLSNLNKRAQFPERLMVPLATTLADEIMTMAETANKATFSEKEAEQVVATTAEIVLRSFNVDPARVQELGNMLGEDGLRQAEQKYNGALPDGQS